MNLMDISGDIKYIGVDDNDIALFENQYDVRGIGITYNSYVIFDESVAVMDTVDCRKFDEWVGILDDTFKEQTPDYIVVSHMEPDHAGSLNEFCKKYPDVKVVGNVKTFAMIDQFFGKDAINSDRRVTVGDGDNLCLGKHTLNFTLAPMIHWPEVMVTYEEREKVLFSADAFGRFGTMEKTANAPWAPQARRYYYNIVGKYGAQVMSLLEKAKLLDVDAIAPLHGPVLRGEALTEAVEYCAKWASYEPEDPDGVLVAYATIYGNTKKAALLAVEELKKKGVRVTPMDLTETDVSYAVMSAFFCGKIILACPTYDGGLFPVMEEFLDHLRSKLFRSRKIGIIENGSWGPLSGRKMIEKIESMRDMTLCENMVTIKSALNEESMGQLMKLVEEI